MAPPLPPAPVSGVPDLVRRLGLFDATMLVMGGIVGSGIFINPYVVARQVGTPALILGAWVLGGLIALVGALVYAELASLRPQVGGQYAYLREAFHPAAAFVYGWCLLLVIQSGGMAAVAVTFARYFHELSHAPLADGAVAVLVLALLTAVNCLGVRAGSGLQSALMVLKIGAIVAMVAAGIYFVEGSRARFTPVLDRPYSFDLLTAMGAALVPTLFAYGGWQTSSFVSGELRRPERDLPRGLLLGVVGVVGLYLAVNLICLRVLGPEGLAATRAPASAVMRQALGERGAVFIGVGITISTLGFLSQGILTAPRVYYAMARDGLFFRSVGWLHPRTRVPVVAIALQGVLAMVIALSGRYEQILNYVVSVDFIAFGLTGAALFVFRHRGEVGAFRTPGHPWTTGFFVAASWLVVLNTVYRYPTNALIGLGLLLAGIPAYLFWRNRGATP
ncbi:MAG TPA: amino acid permease [Vicinamibacteria bacterium]|jgi:APA family basic amino acid/polyamine antiporter|nr:amino acid permease [Vicinamibacteria bacterium]